MIWVKPFDVSEHVLHLKVPIQVFGQEWRACVEDHHRDLTNILEMLDPYFDHWVELFNNPEYPRDIQIASLFKIGYTEEWEGMERVYAWLNTLENLKRELQYIACEFLRRNTFYPKQAKGQKIEFVFAYLYRREIKSYLNHSKYQEFVEDDKSLDQLILDPIENDILLWKNVAKNRWEKYLLYLAYNGFVSLEIAEICKIPRETFYYEENEIWDKIKTLWQTPEQ